MSKTNKSKKYNTGDELSEQTNADILTEDELRMLSASKDKLDRSTLPHYDNSNLALAKRYAKKNKFTVIFVSVTIILVISVIAVLSILLYQKLSNAPSKDDFIMTLGDKDYVIKYKDAVKDDVLYLDIVKIARYAELVVSGDGNTVKITCEDGTYVRFDKNKATATVNGDTVKLGGTTYINTLDADNDARIECLVPYTFIDKLFSYQVEKGTVSMYVYRSAKANEILIRRKIYKDTEKPLPISFNTDCFDIVLG